ncbi:hypothetical protein BT93_H0475 [Corymbia citriodora subsp. variegata]|nr:hypothetical protein BT93_H0475 [Corymbia citriodora subsp. variegata]
MKGFSRSKRVTDPLDERARARLLVGAASGQLSYVSSGSEHDGEDCTPHLSELVQCFLEEGDGGSEVGSPGREPDSDSADSDPDSRADALEDVLARVFAAGAEDPYRNLLLDRVLRAVEAFSGLSASESVLRRRVMSYLRETGHNAAVCKSRWESSGSVTAGNYEFIDVLSPSPASATAPVAWQQQSRYFVDLDFADEFEIARPTSRYARLLRLLPKVFVGTGDELKRIAKMMCDEAKRSLKSQELSVPPWRKSRYTTNKWLGPHRRTVNPEPASGPAGGGVKCRRVGFDEYAVNGCHSVRTR